MALLTLQGVGKRFGSVTAVDDASFTIDRGQVVGFLGPNGAGKSTTMRMITQFLEPDTGEISFDGEQLAANSLAVKRRIGYLPENNPLYPEMLVREYLEFVGELRGIGGADLARAIDETVAATGLEEVFYRPIGDLSKGYRQRVGLAQAILPKPDLLILDEPTEGLDPNQRVEIRHLIEHLGQDRTVLLSTHVLGEVQRTCSRILVINRGRIVADDSVDSLMARATGSVEIHVEATGGAALVQAVQAIPGVTEVIEEGQEPGGKSALTIRASADQDARPAIFGAIKDNGWTLYELHQEARSLESLFRDLTATESEG